MSSDKFLRGAMILTLAGLMVKVIGSVNRILLSRLLGGEGIGLYQMAYPVYLLLLAISAAGIPVAISIIVAGFLAQKDYANVRQVFRVSLRLMACVGAVLAVCLVLAAGWLVDAGVITDARAYYSLIALTPAIFLCYDFSQLPRVFSGTSADDTACRFADCGAVYPRSDDGGAGVCAAALRFGICGCRRRLRRCAGQLDRSCGYGLLLPLLP